MKNCEIINAIFERDKSHRLLNQVNSYATVLNQGYRATGELGKIRDLYEVLSKLEDQNYQVTENDARILRKYNVIVSPLNSSKEMIRHKKFVVTSDFHGYTYPLEKIKNNYLNEYDKIYILGDATDRGIDETGTGSIKLLLDIMELSKQYPDRVIYVPGNHDEFLLGYVRSKHHMDPYYAYSYVASLMYNGGESTIKELNELELMNPKKYDELISWLGKLPLQRTDRYNGKTFVFAHAIFNQYLYDINPNYCLEDYFKETQHSAQRRMANDILWFRKDRDQYNPWEMPSSDKIMVIGHTIEKKRKGKNLNLYDPSGNIIKVHCVDGGIAYGGGMLKYDGGSSVFWTTSVKHTNTSQHIDSSSSKNPEAIFQDYILGLTLNEGTLGICKAILEKNPQNINGNEIKKIVCGPYDFHHPSEVEFMRNLYVKTFLFDYILECQLERMQERYGENAILAVSTSVDRFLHGTKTSTYTHQNEESKGNPYHFTSLRYARDIAIAMGPAAMEEVLKAQGYKTVDEYVTRKFSKTENGKTLLKKGQTSYS